MFGRAWTLLLCTTLALLVIVPQLAAQTPGDNCPLSFTAVANANGSVMFHWVGFGGADGYQVYGHAGQGNMAGYSPLLSGGARDWTQTEIASGLYAFHVVAFHSGSIVASSCERTIQVGQQLVAPCPAPVTATVQPPSSILLSWPPVTNAVGYRVARSVDGGALVHDYGNAAQAVHPTFTDPDAPAGHSYAYRVSSEFTRYPPEACSPVSIEAAEVPFFPTPLSWALGGLASLVGAAAILRHRPRAP